MQVDTRVRLVRIAGLVLTLPIAFLLFAVAVSIDAGLVVGLLVVFLPLALFGVGLAVLLRGLAGADDEPTADSDADRS